MTVTYRTKLSSGTQRDAWIEVNLAALERNYKKISSEVSSEVMAVIKADAYGHGATTIAPILQSLGINSFGVATVDEGIELRKCGIKKEILVLGAVPFWSYSSCIDNDLTISIHSLSQIEALAEKASEMQKKLKVQLKINTGMNRIGVDINEVEESLTLIKSFSSLELVGVFSHLSEAENKEFSMLQKERFDKCLANLKGIEGVPVHLANSFAALNYKDFAYDLVRNGIALYGCESSLVEPLISIKGRVTQLHVCKQGESVGYDRTWTAKKDSVIATIPIGYADGVNRRLSNKIQGKYKGQKINQVGNITMDQMMFDVTDITEVKEGEVITLIDDELTVKSWADILGTISYELLCRFKLRLPRVYTRN